MSYIVPDKIPSYCAECNWSICSYPNAYCKRVHKTIELLMAIKKRPDFCPLIEIPTPHGRLGDLDALLEKAYLNYNKATKKEENYKIINENYIINAPTIIEAEE